MNKKNKDYRAMWSSHHFWIAVVAIAVLYVYPEIKKVNPDLAMVFAALAVAALFGFFIVKGLRFDIARWISTLKAKKNGSSIPEPGSRKSRAGSPLCTMFMTFFHIASEGLVLFCVSTTSSGTS